jgi:hypothetical protein
MNFFKIWEKLAQIPQQVILSSASLAIRNFGKAVISKQLMKLKKRR